MRLRRALTLLEVLIALTLLIVFLFSFFRFLNGVRISSEKIAQEIEREELVDAVDLLLSGSELRRSRERSVH